MDNDKLKELEKKDTINDTSLNVETKDELGYIKVSIKELPSKGLFYPADIYIGIKPATVKEIRQWSMIDETDEYSFIEAVDFVLKQCVILKTGKGQRLSISDLCEVDRLYLVFAVRERTFEPGTNDIYVDVPYTYKGEEYKDSVHITKDKLVYFDIPEKIMKFYNETKRCFVVEGDKNEFNVRLASVGISQWITNYAREKVRENKPFDEFFIKVSPFLLTDYENMKKEEFFNMEVESQAWGPKDISVLDRITQIFSEGAKSGFNHKTKHGGEEVVVPLNFRGGVKSLFIISDALGELD